MHDLLQATQYGIPAYGVGVLSTRQLLPLVADACCSRRTKLVPPEHVPLRPLELCLVTHCDTQSYDSCRLRDAAEVSVHNEGSYTIANTATISDPR